MAKTKYIYLRMTKDWGGFTVDEIVRFGESKGVERIGAGVGVKASPAEIKKVVTAAAEKEKAAESAAAKAVAEAEAAAAKAAAEAEEAEIKAAAAAKAAEEAAAETADNPPAKKKK